MVAPVPPKGQDSSPIGGKKEVKKPEELKKEAGPGILGRFLSAVTFGYLGGRTTGERESTISDETRLAEREIESRRKGGKVVLESSPLDIPEDPFSKDFIDGYNQRIYDLR